MNKMILCGIGLVGMLLCAIPATAQTSPLSATQQYSANGIYTPGSPVDITVHFVYTGSSSVTSLGFQINLPEGWTYAGFVNVSDPHNPPFASTTGTEADIDFFWLAVPSLPFSFVYRVNVPETASGPQTIASRGLYSEGNNPVVTQGFVSDIVHTEGDEGEGTAEGEGSTEGMTEGEGSTEGSVEGEGTPEGSVEGEGSTEGSVEGEGTPEGSVEGEGSAEGSVEGEGSTEGSVEGEGSTEGTVEGEGSTEGTVEGEGSAEGEGETPCPFGCSCICDVMDMFSLKNAMGDLFLGMLTMMALFGASRMGKRD